MSDTDVEAIAERIVDELFTNNEGYKARRLELKILDPWTDTEKSGGGWCREAAKDRIVDVLKECLLKGGDEDGR
jgi:hypothetical protein